MNKIVQYNLSIDLAEVTKAAVGAPEFLALPSSVKAKFYDAREIFRKMSESVKSGKSLRSAAREASEKFGITPSKARRLFKEVQDSNGHWTAFIDTRHSSVLWRKKKEQTKLPKAFLDYWRGLCMENQRCNRQAWMKLLRAWERWRTGAGEPIPGYDTPPTSYGSGNYPEGWSYNNLLRHAPTSFELAAVRQSRGAAMSKLPCVRTTREDLHFFGEIQFDDMWHDNNYYAASIAHNVVTIRMEGETFPGWPDRKYAVANHGGMYKTTGGVVQAYETNDIFTYIAGNSTACYRPEKCRKMIRQFVFVLPDYFVVCDTVESVRDDQAKTWLLHSQNEPVGNGDIFRFEEGKGRLFCRTFLPENYRRTKIGGPGKEFWVDGKNYPQGKTRMEEYRKKGITNPLWGNWRMEIAPGEKCTKVRFLNLIQVGMKDQLREMTAAEYRKEGTSEGVRFETEKGTFTVLFDSDGSGGKIRAEKNGKVFLDQELTRKIQPQKAFQK